MLSKRLRRVKSKTITYLPAVNLFAIYPLLEISCELQATEVKGLSSKGKKEGR